MVAEALAPKTTGQGGQPETLQPYWQYVWGVRYIDDLVLRDRDADQDSETGDLGKTDSGLEERLYALQDANWNVVALAEGSGAVQERDLYFPFGKPIVLGPTFGGRGTSSYDWEHLYTGRRYDPETGLYYYRNRYYHPGLGRFVSRDPIGYAAGDASLYRYLSNRPPNYVDPPGLWGIWDIVDRILGKGRGRRFWDEWTEQQRKAWFNEFERKFGAYITASARKHCVPRELLAAVTANEYVDMQRGEEFAEPLGFGKSLGPAQIRVRLAKKYQITPKGWHDFFRARVAIEQPDVARVGASVDFDEYLREYLRSPETGIDAAATLMRRFRLAMCLDVKKVSTKKPYGIWSKSFWADVLSLTPNRGPQNPRLERFIYELCCKNCNEVVKMDVHPELIRAMAAAFNDDYLDVMVANPVNMGVRKHIWNAEWFDDVFLLK